MKHKSKRNQNFLMNLMNVSENDFYLDISYSCTQRHCRIEIYIILVLIFFFFCVNENEINKFHRFSFRIGLTMFKLTANRTTNVTKKQIIKPN